MDPRYEPPIYRFYRYVAGWHHLIIDIKQYRADKKAFYG